MTWPKRDLAVVVPSRGRPGQAAALVDACQQTCVADSLIVVAVDEDDPTLPAYAEALTGRSAQLLQVPAGGGHVGAINAAAVTLAPATYALAKLDDDHMPLTYGWDGAYLAALRELGTGIVYGNDLLQGANLPTAVGLTSDIVQALGYMGPPQLRHLFVDNFWLELGRRAGCLRYLPDVVVEHRHPLAGKAPWDAGYDRANHVDRYRDDGAAWSQYCTLRLPADVATVRALRGTA